ncbi:MAG TPA: hypothetical protein PKH33_10270 [bacterium]|nr:hypothetical protein [bacterium]
MFDDHGFDFDDFLLLGGIYYLADVMEKEERKLAAENPEQAENEAKATLLGCVITICILIGIIVVAILL